MKEPMKGNKSCKNVKKALRKEYRKDQKWGGWRKWMKVKTEGFTN